MVTEEAAKHPDKPVEVWATDEHRIGLKPIIRRVWAPKGQRPIALGHHRYKWLYVTAFVQPISGEVFWYVSNGVSKPFFAALLALFAREAGTRAHDRARARQRRLAHRAEHGRARWDPARLLAPLLPRASARRAPVACPRRAARKPVLRDPRRSRTRRRRALLRSQSRSAQT